VKGAITIRPRPVVSGTDAKGRRFWALVVTGTTTKKTSNRIVSIEKGARCRSCRYPQQRESCSECGNALVGRQAVMPADNFRDWQKTAIPELRMAWGRRAPLTCEVEVTAIFYRERNVGDLVGYQQALADVLQDAEILSNDRQIVAWDGSRMRKDPARPRVEIGITELGAAPMLFEPEEDEVDWENAPAFEEVAP